MHVLRAVLWGQLIGLVVGLVVTSLVAGWPTLSWVRAGALAGLSGGVGITAFYYALGRSPMSIVAPISASAVVGPVAVSLLRGEVPGAMALAGVLLISVGILTISIVPPHPGEQRAFDRVGAIAAVVAAIGFAMTLTLMDRAAGDGMLAEALWAAIGMRFGSIVVVLAGLLVTRTRPTPPAVRNDWLTVAGIGLFDTGANALYTVAVSTGNLAVVAALASLYPATTVLLARLVDGERTTAWQRIGIILAIAGMVLASAG